MKATVLPKEMLLLVLKGQGYKEAKDGDMAMFDGKELIWFNKKHFEFCGKEIDIDKNDDFDDLRLGRGYIQMTQPGYNTWNKFWFVPFNKV